MRFWKMTAGGNDFIIFDNRSKPSFDLTANEINFLCTRKLSIGADGLIVMEESKKADILMRYFNADGSAAPLCGNGVRCLARLAFNLKIAQDNMKIETGAGIITAEEKGENIRLQMLPPAKLRLHQNINLENEIIEGHSIDVGAPFYVIPYREIENCPVDELGHSICHHSFFDSQRGTNVSFFKVIDENNVRLRIFERGVEDETLSCGTGSLATSLVTAALGLVKSPVNCHTQGGTTIRVNFSYKEGKFDNPSIEGDARLIYEGKLNPQILNK